MTANENPARWAALGEQVRLRRRALHLRQVDVEDRGGPSTATVRAIEQGARHNFGRSTLAALARALEWPEDVPRRIVDGTATDEDVAIRSLTVSGADSATSSTQVRIDRFPEPATPPEDRLNRIYHQAHSLVGELMTAPPTDARARAQAALLDLLHELVGEQPG